MVSIFAGAPRRAQKPSIPPPQPGSGPTKRVSTPDRPLSECANQHGYLFPFHRAVNLSTLSRWSQLVFRVCNRGMTVFVRVGRCLYVGLLYWAYQIHITLLRHLVLKYYLYWATHLPFQWKQESKGARASPAHLVPTPIVFEIELYCCMVVVSFLSFFGQAKSAGPILFCVHGVLQARIPLVDLVPPSLPTSPQPHHLQGAPSKESCLLRPVLPVVPPLLLSLVGMEPSL